MRGSSGHGDERRRAGVVFLFEREEFLARQPRDRLDGSRERPPQRVVGPEGFGKEFLYELARIVVDHEDFLADHVPLALDLRRGELRMQHHVAQHIAKHRQVRGSGLGIIACVVFGREGVQIAAQPFHGLRDFQGVAPLGALEHEVFEEMRNAAE